MISSKGHSEEISLFMIDDNFNKKLMNYNDKNLVIFAFNDDNENIKKDPIVITILTDKSKINIDKILDYGELIELEKKNIFN